MRTFTLILCGWIFGMVMVMAQTAGSPGEGLKAEPGSNPGTVAASWWGKPGRTYFVQSNATLEESGWSFMPVVLSGAGGVSGYNFQASGERLFVRLLYTDQAYSGTSAADADFDGDGLSNLVEVTQQALPPPPSESASESEYAASSSPPPGTGAGSNPFLVDSDGDGYTDREEYTAGTSNANPGSNPGTYAPPSGVLNPDTSYVNGLQLQYRAKWMWSRWTGTGGSFNPTPPIYNFLSEGGAYHHANLETTSPALYPRTQAFYDLYPYISPAYEGASFLAAPVTMFSTNAELWAGQNYRQERTELGYGNVYYYRRENVRRVFEITPVASGGAAADAQRFCAVRLQSYNYSTAQWGVVDTGLVSFQRNFAFCSPNVATYCKASGAKVLTEPPLLYSSPPDIDASPSVVDRKQTIMTSLVPLDIRIVPDYDRDGDIDDNDKNQVSTHNPWRWWINDDDDWGDTAANDTPGQGTYADFRGFTVDGLTDLPDFFPVQLQIKGLVDVFPPSSFEYRLFHPNGALSFVETSLDAGSARQFLTNGAVAESMKDAATRRMVTEGPNLLSTNFLSALQQNTAKGVILVQGSAATDVPFHLQVIQNNKVYATISFPVKITPVEQFYRWINLRGVPDLDPGRNGAPIGTVARATAVGVPPNRPDSLTSNKHFVFMHGYNVDEDSARGWGSEIFKRMYQLGMKAKFTMVTWRGNKSQVGGVTPDYWQNVTNAFITAPHLKTALDSLPGTKLLTAHSLGNMVACSAIKDHGLAVEQYFMLDAAVPLEAIDESADSRATMRHPEWAEYDQTLNGTDLRQYWASDWYKQFLFTNDARKTLTWKGRFGDIPNATNYYSSGEEVLQNSDGTFPGPGGLRAWVQQELSKGRPDSVMGMAPYNDPQGGWGHNAYWFMPGPNPQKRTPQELLDVPLSATAENPFFMRFRFSYLHDNTLGSATAADYWVRNKTLGAGIPAISNPVGSNPIGSFDVRNIDLMTKRDSWPIATGPREKYPNRWLHSDAKDVALRFNHPLYIDWITRGNL
jgi:hypothetical protein